MFSKLRLLPAILCSLALFGVLMIDAPHIQAETAPNVKGYVRQVDGSPIPGIWVQMKVVGTGGSVNNSGALQYAKTDQNGKYVFPVWHSSQWQERNNGGVESLENAQRITQLLQPSGWERLRVSENRDIRFGCGQNPMEISVVVPAGWNGDFVRKDTGSTQFVMIDVSNEADTVRIVDFEWRPKPPAACPELRKSICTQEKNADGHVRAEFNWSNIDTNIAQYVFVLQKQGLPFETNTVSFMMNPAYTGNPILSAINHHLYVRTTARSVPVWVEPGVQYSWQVQPGRDGWPIPYNNLWDNHPYNSPWCPGEELVCQYTNQGNATLSADSCQVDLSGNFSTEVSVSAYWEYLQPGFFGQGRLDLALETNTPATATFLRTFFGQSITSDQESASGNVRILVPFNQVVALSDFASADNNMQAANYVFTQDHLLTPAQTLADLNAQVLAAGIDPDTITASLVFVNRMDGIDVTEAQSEVDLFCEPLPNSCSDIETPTVSDLALPSSGLISPDAENLTITWSVPSQLQQSVRSFEVAVVASQTPPSDFDQAVADNQALVKTISDKTATRIDIPLSEIEALYSLNSSFDLHYAVRAIITTTTGTDACPWIPETDSLTYEVGVNLYETNSDDLCKDETPFGGSLSNSTYWVNGVERGNSLTSAIFPYPDQGSIELRLDTSTGYQCACGTCLQTVLPSQKTIDIYLSDGLTHSSWWQVLGGLIFAENRVQSNLPIWGSPIALSSACAANPICNPFLGRTNPAIDRDDGNTTASIVLTDGSISPTIHGSSIASFIRQSADSNTNASAENADASQKQKLNYASLVDALNPSAATQTTTLSNLTGGETRADARIIHLSGNVSITSPVQIAAGQKVIVLIDGNLSVEADAENQEMISAPIGSFLLFATSGNITFEPAVGRSDYDSEDSVVQGIFLADNQLVIDGDGDNDIKFVGEGTFVGWNEVQLQRNINDRGKAADATINDKHPLELFIHRPDFTINTPESIKETSITWQEVL